MVLYHFQSGLETRTLMIKGEKRSNMGVSNCSVISYGALNGNGHYLSEIIIHYDPT